jgi:uncharacterized Zn-binding protein involved in type VI secretion
MRAFGKRSGVVPVVVGAALVVMGCATSPSAYRNRDEPINRTTGVGQQYGQEYRGTVMRVDEPQHVVVLENGQMYRVGGNRTVLVNGQPVVLGRVQPGTPVTIVSGTPVVYQNGQYVAASGSQTVVTAPAGTVVTGPATRTVRMVGRVTDLDSDGTVEVEFPDGKTFEFRAPAGTVWRKGDSVTIDMTPAGAAPSALPR